MSASNVYKFIFIFFFVYTENINSAFSHDMSIYNDLFPQRTTIPQKDKAIEFKLNGDIKQKLLSVLFSASANNLSGRDVTWCGLIFLGPKEKIQGEIAIGQGYTDSVSCIGLEKSALMPSQGKITRLGFIYRTRSQNAVSMTPVVFYFDMVSGRWKRDDALGEILSEVSNGVTINRMKTVLSKKR